MSHEQKVLTTQAETFCYWIILKKAMLTFNCFQGEIVTVRNRLQGKVAEMENFAGHLEEIFLTVEVKSFSKHSPFSGTDCGNVF